MAAEDNYEAKSLYATSEEANKACNGWVEKCLNKNKVVRFLLEHLEEMGCQPPSNFIKCIDCAKPAAGGFGVVQESVMVGEDGGDSSSSARSSSSSSSSSDGNKKTITTTVHTSNNKPVSVCDAVSEMNKTKMAEMLKSEKDGKSCLSIKPEIYLCQQYMDSELMVAKTLVHELIHSIDYCRTKMDPLHNCLHLACTEIRAENLSGECTLFKEIPRMQQFKGHGRECVKRRAILSVRANPKCTERAEEYVDAAMNRCSRDYYPFKRHPNLQ